MGWDVDLEKDGKIVTVSPHQTGSNLQAELQDGHLVAIDQSEAHCTITYNYGTVYHLVDFSMDNMNGLTGRETIGILRNAVEKLGTKKYGDYWAPTPGNAGSALQTLLSWAEQHPDAVWKIT